MKTKLFCSLLICIVIFTSCENKVDHEKAVSFYRTISAEMITASETVNGFWDQMTTAAEAAQNSPDKKIDSTYADSLYRLYESANLALTKAIDNISGLEEADPELNLKEETVLHLKETISIQESAIPDVIQILRNGLDKMTTVQRESFLDFQTKGGKLQKDAEILKLNAEIFMKKNGITDEELERK